MLAVLKIDDKRILTWNMLFNQFFTYSLEIYATYA